MERPTLYVEGEDDAHAIIHLLAQHGIELDRDAGPVYVRAVGSDSQLMKTIGLAAKAAPASTVGFVVDIDTTAAQRWQAVSSRLAPLGVKLDDMLSPLGFADDAPGGRRIGAWMMPDNKRNGGCLEHLLDELIPAGNPIRPFAEEATDRAQALGAPFPEKYRLKAIIRAWLAWQEEPGVAYGTAIKAGFLHSDSRLVREFVDWFRKLYEPHLH